MPGYDVAILGGGPAGTAAGLTLLKRAGLKVALVEQSEYQHPRIGESLSPGIRPLLEYLDFWPVFQASQNLETYGSQACWGSEQVNSLDYLFTLHGKGWSLDRRAFDETLASEFARRGGTACLSQRFEQASPQADGSWQIHLSSSKGDRSLVNARFIIDATGRKSQVSRQLGGQRITYDSLVGVGCFADCQGGQSYDHHLMVEACEYGWWYTSPLPHRKMAVVLMTDADIAAKKKMVTRDTWMQLLRETRTTSRIAKGVRIKAKPRSFLAFSAHLKQAGGRNWVAVGDALASHDPLSSSGIPHAISSGVYGARVADDTLNGSGKLLPYFTHDALRDFAQYRKTHWQYYRKERRWPESLFWKRRITPVTLDPNLPLPEMGAWTGTDNPHLSGTQLAFFQALPQQCHTVHAAVSAFKEKYPKLPDQNIILGLQHALEMNPITPSSATNSAL